MYGKENFQKCKEFVKSLATAFCFFSNGYKGGRDSVFVSKKKIYLFI